MEEKLWISKTPNKEIGERRDLQVNQTNSDDIDIKERLKIDYQNKDEEV